MDVRRSEPSKSIALAYDAEALIQSLAGVVSAHVRTGTRGIDAIHVTARDQEAARFMAAHVRSALLAGLATPVIAARIHVRVDHQPDDQAEDQADERQRNDGVPGAASHSRNGNGTRRPDDHAQDPPPAHAYRAGDDSDAGRPRRGVWMVDGHGPEPSRERAATDPSDDPRDVQPRPDPATTPWPVPRGGAATALADDDEPGAIRPAIQRPRLVAVDVDRPGDGRVVCRVAVAYGTLVHRAEAVAVDLPGAAAQAAAQAAVRAMVDAGIGGLELNGLREVEIAGRDYVIVALGRSDTSPRHRSGSAPIVGSAERSAAEAAVAAVNELL